MSTPYLNAPIRARMYKSTMHKLIWVGVLVLSLGLLAPALFFVAPRRNVSSACWYLRSMP